MINSLKNLGRAIRYDIDNSHTRWYKIAFDLAVEVNVEEGKLRTCHRQINRSNILADCTLGYYKRSITIPVVDHLNLELARRFKESSTNVCYVLHIIPSKFISFLSHSKSGSARCQDKFTLFATMFTDDLPSPIALDGELELWKTNWKSKEQDSLVDNISSTLKAINFPGFEKIKVLISKF